MGVSPLFNFGVPTFGSLTSVNDSIKLVGDGYISLGRNCQSRKDRPDIISYVLCGEPDPGD